MTFMPVKAKVLQLAGLRQVLDWVFQRVFMRWEWEFRHPTLSVGLWVHSL
ncbi:hypothetical protein [Lunatimonas salinarum]|nr:hypothetical protein [Lunatimonas salinarum]